MKEKTIVKRLCCLLLSAILLALTGTDYAQAATTTGITLNTSDFKSKGEHVFDSYGVMKKTVSGDDGRYTYFRSLPEGETVYLTDTWKCIGTQYYVAVYKGKAYNVLQSAVADVKSVHKPSLKKKDDIVKQQGFVDNDNQGGAYAYIYSAPDDTNPQKCYATLYGGYVLQILDADYNEDWMKILYKDSLVTYIKKEDVNIKDTYLIGASYSSMLYIAQAKKAKLAHKGILGDYDKDITKMEFCRLAVQWYKAMGNKLPKANKTSPFKDTKNKYVILAHQLGIIESTSDQKFHPKDSVSHDTYNELIANLMEVAGAPSDSRAVAKIDYMSVLRKTVSREEAIVRLYKALQPSLEKGYLVSDTQVAYTIKPYDNQDVCLDAWDWSDKPGSIIGLWDSKSADENRANQRFKIYRTNGYYTLLNDGTKCTLTSGTSGVVQYDLGIGAQKLTFEYNDDGTVCIRDENGKYMDLKDGTAYAGGELIFREKTGSSSQKFIFEH